MTATDVDRVKAALERLPKKTLAALAFCGQVPTAAAKAARALEDFRKTCEVFGIEPVDADRYLDEELRKSRETPEFTFFDAVRAARRRISMGERPQMDRATVLKIRHILDES